MIIRRHKCESCGTVYECEQCSEAIEMDLERLTTTSAPCCAKFVCPMCEPKGKLIRGEFPRTHK